MELIAVQSIVVTVQFVRQTAHKYAIKHLVLEVIAHKLIVI